MPWSRPLRRMTPINASNSDGRSGLDVQLHRGFDLRTGVIKILKRLLHASDQG